jgi:hypothetical protein
MKRGGYVYSRETSQQATEVVRELHKFVRGPCMSLSIVASSEVTAFYVLEYASKPDKVQVIAIDRETDFADALTRATTLREQGALIVLHLKAYSKAWRIADLADVVVMNLSSECSILLQVRVTSNLLMKRAQARFAEIGGHCSPYVAESLAIQLRTTSSDATDVMNSLLSQSCAYQESRACQELGLVLQRMYDAPQPTMPTVSGMAAIATILEAAKQHGYMRVIYPTELYCDSFNLVQRGFGDDTNNDGTDALSFDCGHTAQDMQTAFEALLPHMQSKTIVFLESATNPRGFTCDWATLLQPIRARFPGLLVVVDNTWLTHVVHTGRQLAAYADIVVLSLTKHYSNGSVVAGAAVPISQHGCALLSIGRNLGATVLGTNHMAEHTAEVLLSQLGSMEARINSARIQADAFETALRRTLPDVILFRHPATSVLACVVPIDWKELRRRLTKNRYEPFVIKTSYGSHESRICPWINEYVYQAHTSLVRINIGWQSTDDTESLVAAFARLVEV